MEFPGAEGVLILILKRLPVKSLLKFLCVSKSWYSLIKTSYFISSHQNHHQHHHQNHRRLFFYHSNIHGIWHSGSTSPEWIHIPMPMPVPVPLPMPVNLTDRRSVVGSCNGLFLIRNIIDRQYEEYYRELSVWNPSIRKNILVPLPTSMLDYPSSCRDLGFGHDPFTNDYKVVAINYGFATLPDNAQFYSFNSGTWKNVRLPDYSNPSRCLLCYSNACFLKGVLYWIPTIEKVSVPNTRGGTGTQKVICNQSLLTFDIRKEAFGDLITIPSRLRSHGQGLNLAVIDNSLALLIPDQFGFGIGFGGLDNQYVIWKMQESGVEISWIFLYKIQVSEKYGRDPNFWVGRIREEGEVFIPTIWEPWVFFKDKNQSSSIMNVVNAIYYTESLVLIDHKRESSQEDNPNSKRHKREEDYNLKNHCKY